jgi:hypothetical protein
MRAAFRIAIGLGIAFVNTMPSVAKADDCDSGHGCLISCDDGCVAAYVGYSHTCTKFCVETASTSKSSLRQPQIVAQKSASASTQQAELSDAEIQVLLKQEATKQKLSAILCPPSEPPQRSRER